jgi:hypothetical protein
MSSSTVRLDISDFVLNSYTALEIEFPTQIEKKYQVRMSDDLIHWVDYGTPIDGTGQRVFKLLSTRPTKYAYVTVEQR